MHSLLSIRYLSFLNFLSEVFLLAIHVLERGYTL